MFKKIILGGLMAVAAMGARADEGMWVLHNIDPRTQAVMQQLGLKLSAQELYDAESGVSLKDAVVDFGDFCSGVVVSPNGLVFTNHHCGFGAIQALSTTDDDILKNGFVAHSYSEERPAEGLSVFFLQQTDDITDKVEEVFEALQEKDKNVTRRVFEEEFLETFLDDVKEAYTIQYPGREIRVQSFYGGSKFCVSVYKQYKDIRLVFTPTESLGKFGGDTDNWMWPRQTCDFSVFRIYADKDGNPAEYSKDNVPLHPKRWAQVSTDGYAAGDYCMTIGYPGSTDRYLSSYGIVSRMENENKPRIEVRGLKQDVWSKWMKSDRAIGLKYASKFANSSNYWKNSIGMNQALTNLGVVGQKQQLEKRIGDWVALDAARQQRFGGMLDTLKTGYAASDSLILTAMYMSESISGMEICKLASLAEQFSVATDSASANEAIKAIEAFMKDYDAKLDEETTAVLLENLAKRIDAQYLEDVKDVVDEKYAGNYKAYVHDIFSKTQLLSEDPVRYIVLADDIDKDPAIEFKSAMRLNLIAAFMEMRSLLPSISYNEQLLTQAFLEMEQEQPHYSDANFSMRLSYGIVQDYTANGNHFQYYTNAQSLLDKAAKQNEIEDYLLEDNLISLLKKGEFGRYADKRTGEMQLCFISNNDITGGNSGSPMFNGKGELIGLAFDGNWEAMSGDISFDPALQRCIGVDIRFVLYLIDKWGHADNLIQELGLK